VTGGDQITDLVRRASEDLYSFANS